MSRMQLFFKTTKLRKEFEDERALLRNRGPEQAKRIMLRLAQIDAVESLEELRHLTGHYHELHEDRSGWLACDLDGNYRLIFEPAVDPAPRNQSGGLDWSAVRAVTILGVLDYHERNKKQPK